MGDTELDNIRKSYLVHPDSRRGLGSTTFKYTKLIFDYDYEV